MANWQNISIDGIDCADVIYWSIIEQRTISVVHGANNPYIDYSNATNLADLPTGEYSFNGGKITMTISNIADNARKAEIYCNGVLTNAIRVYYPSYVTNSYLFACVDTDNNIGCLGYFEYNHVSQVWAYTYLDGIVFNNQNNFTENVYEALQTVTYNWQSVPSISGKNGILSLVTLDSESINDGEPVSGAAVSVFDQAPSNDNNIKNLADTYGGGEESSVVDVTVKYKVTLPPGGSFSTLKIVAKKDSIPEDASDGDKIVDISPSKTKKTVTGLDENSLYYFKIFGEDTNSNTSESDEKHITTSGDEGWLFDYTGEIQTFTAPKTGIYQLETWGAQGNDATDGTRTARGGYGAYAVGEVLLTQGETIYINVGGQDGYGGGGNGSIEYALENRYKTADLTHYVTGGNGYNSGIPSAFANYKNSDYILFTSQTYSAGYVLAEMGNQITANANQAYGYICIPFRDLTNIVRIEFDIKIAQNVSGVGFSVLVKANDFSDDIEAYYETPMTQKDWTHISYEVPANQQSLVCNYFQFTVEHSQVQIKNVKFICST